MMASFDIITAPFLKLTNVFLPEEVIVGCLKFEISTNIVKQIIENEVYLHSQVTPALIEMIW